MKMREEKNDNERLDAFSGYMKQRLENHRLPIDEGDWAALEARMNQKSSRPAWLWGGGMIAAAIVIGLIWMLPLPEEMPPRESVFQPEIISRQREKAEPMLPMPISGIVVERKMAAMAVVFDKMVMVDEVGMSDVDDVVDEDAMDEPVADVERKKPVGKQPDRTVPEAPGNKRYRKGKKQEKRMAQNERKGWMLAAGAGTSGYVRPTQMPMDDFVFDGPANDVVNGGGNGSLNNGSNNGITNGSLSGNHYFESYPDVSHSVPVSFSFMARKNLNRHLAIEGGLTYTYLSSTFRQDGVNHSEVKSRLHYLGIPLNLVVYLWNASKWNVYMTGGVMIEKGLLATYDEYTVRGLSVYDASWKEGIKGLQCSANASLGISYRLSRDWSLYAEPRLSYSFDTDQPASIRTDKPLGFGLNAGIRFDF